MTIFIFSWLSILTVYTILLRVKNFKLEKSKLQTIVKSENLFNENFTPLPDDCKADSLIEAITSKLVHKIAQYRNSIEREKIITHPSKVCLFWKPGTIFIQHQDSFKDYSILVLLNNNKCLWLDDGTRKDLMGKQTENDFASLINTNIELLALPEEYIK